MRTACLAALLCVCSTVTQAAEPARIVIRADQAGAAISPTLYGIFFEEINHAGDGGLYAELIQNRSFEETLPIEGCTQEGDKCVAPASPHYINGSIKRWSASWKFDRPIPSWTLDAGAGSATMQLESAAPLHPNNVRYLRLAVGRPGNDAQPVRLWNDGYWGIAVRQGEGYDLSLFARRGDGASIPLRVGLADASGKVLAEAALEIQSTGWQRLSCELRPNATEAKARLFIEPRGAGKADLDVVSLFPKQTFKNRPNGCRADLAQMLADLKPGFMRFPGGCVVEGATMANRYRWKETIGPIESRPGHWSVWGYRNVDGLGYHEFLQLCEDIGAQGMYVANCGLSCEGRNGDFGSDEQIDALLQETLDAIEYALGGVQTRWGAARAKAGHPAPLPLKYVEVGNENHGPRYDAIYRRFAPAIKKAWPQITVICNVHLDDAEVEDQHFYVEPAFFLANHRRYDTAPRQIGGMPAPRVYVGEFAVNRDVGSGNLQAAISEAAFMLGMERNGDLVTMCSYAPLFFNVNRLDWPVNMIGYDSAVAFGRTSYHAQQMFASNLADVNVSCDVTGPSIELGGQGGLIGVGTWATQAEFKDIRVISTEGKTLLAADFSHGTKGWKMTGGKWSTAEGALRQTGDDSPATAMVGQKNWNDYTLTLKARKLSGREGFLISFASSGHGKSWWNLGGWGNRQHGLEIPGISPERVEGNIETGRWYDVRIEVSAARIRCLLDGKVVHDVSRQRSLPALYATAGRVTASGEIIVKVVNAAPTAVPATLKVDGAKGVADEALLVVMSHADAKAENSVTEPRKIVPVRETLRGASQEFSHVFPANSVSVLRLKAR